MRLNVFVLSALLFFLACRSSDPVVEKLAGREKEQVKPELLDSLAQYFYMNYDYEVITPDSEYVLINLSSRKLQSRYGRRKGVYGKESVRYWNVYFYNLTTGAGHLLSREKIGIEEINVYNNRTSSVKVLDGKIMYVLKDTDYNNDGLLNYLDPEFLFVSDYDGSNLQRLSPEGENMTHYSVIPGTDDILIKTERDSNQDSLFGWRDNQVWYHARLVEGQWKLSEIIDESSRHEIDSLFFQQWMEIKE